MKTWKSQELTSETPQLMISQMKPQLCKHQKKIFWILKITKCKKTSTKRGHFYLVEWMMSVLLSAWSVKPKKLLNLKGDKNYLKRSMQGLPHGLLKKCTRKHIEAKNIKPQNSKESGLQIVSSVKNSIWMALIKYSWIIQLMLSQSFLMRDS